MSVEITVNPFIPNITVSNNPSVITPDLSNYPTLSNLYSVSGDINETIVKSGSYLYNLINTSAAGVSSLNGASGILTILGTGNIYVSTAGQTILISGEGQSPQLVNLYGFISTGDADLRYLNSGVSGSFYASSNPNFYIRSGDVIGTYATIAYLNLISGELATQIQMGGGGGSGIASLNSLDGAINLISSNDYLSFVNVGNNININEKPQNITIYRNDSSQITGVQKNIEFIKIYRNINDQITGVYYNNYYKIILLDQDENITGVNVIHQ